MVWLRLAGGLYIKVSNNLSKSVSTPSWSWKVEWSILLSCVRHSPELLGVMQGAGITGITGITVNLYCKLGLGDIEAACKGRSARPKKFCFLSFTLSMILENSAYTQTRPPPLPLPPPFLIADFFPSDLFPLCGHFYFNWSSRSDCYAPSYYFLNAVKLEFSLPCVS